MQEIDFTAQNKSRIRRDKSDKKLHFDFYNQFNNKLYPYSSNEKTSFPN